MVKRKAENTLDEWLNKGTLYAEASRAGTVELINQQVTEPDLGTEVTPLTAETAGPSEATADLAEQNAAEWLWELLAQSGYELW